MANTVEIIKDMVVVNVGLDMALRNYALSYKLGKETHTLVSTKYKTLSKIRNIKIGDYVFTFYDNALDINEKINNIVEFVPYGSICNIEGYSFGSISNRALQGAEFIGVVKYHLKSMDCVVNVVNPSTLKKHSTGKGNADKRMMFNSLPLDIQKNLIGVIDHFKSFNINLKIEKQPISDIVDAIHLSRHKE